MLNVLLLQGAATRRSLQSQWFQHSVMILFRTDIMSPKSVTLIDSTRNSRQDYGHCLIDFSRVFARLTAYTMCTYVISLLFFLSMHPLLPRVTFFLSFSSAILYSLYPLFLVSFLFLCMLDFASMAFSTLARASTSISISISILLDLWYIYPDYYLPKVSDTAICYLNVESIRLFGINTFFVFLFIPLFLFW